MSEENSYSEPHQRGSDVWLGVSCAIENHARVEGETLSSYLRVTGYANH